LFVFFWKIDDHVIEQLGQSYRISLRQKYIQHGL